jgi:alkylhydroperoxidase family enzyme
MQRISIKSLEPNAYKVMLGMEEYISNSALSPLLREMIKIRASQLNGCVYC